MELANQIYVFCPEYGKGVMFYDQSPSDVVAKFAGTLPEGKFYSSGEKIVEWDDKVNGTKNDIIPVNSQTSLLVNNEKVDVHDGSSFSAITIIVSQDNFLKILDQIQKPVVNQDKNYKIIDFNSRIVDYKTLNILTSQEEIDNKKR